MYMHNVDTFNRDELDDEVMRRTRMYVHEKIDNIDVEDYVYDFIPKISTEVLQKVQNIAGNNVEQEEKQELLASLGALFYSRIFEEAMDYIRNSPELSEWERAQEDLVYRAAKEGVAPEHLK